VRAFAHFDPQFAERDAWRIDPGDFEIRIGSSSRDIRLREVVKIPAR
jgi:hypothetical protein